MLSVAVAVLAACVVGVIASVAMTRASDYPAAWNIAFGGAFALLLALALFVAVLVIERMAFP